jgi:cytochrome d ubiquinol oxidase subunit II
MGYNNKATSIFVGELFTSSPILFVLPALTVLAGIMVIYYGYKEKGRQLFIHTVAVMALFLITGFVGMFPNVVVASNDVTSSIQIIDAMSASNSLRIILVAVIIFFPIIIGYQTWKYIKFKKRLTDVEG